MAQYLLFESQNPAGTQGLEKFWSLALDLKGQGHEVVLFLVENGVFPARSCTYTAPLEDLARKGITIWADRFSLQERGILRDRIMNGLQIKDMDDVVECLAQGYKTLWH